MTEYKFSPTKSQIELAQSEYPLDRTWWCESCNESCEVIIIDAGDMPNCPQAQAVSKCCKGSMIDTDPKVAYEETTGQCWWCIAEFSDDSGICQECGC